MSYEQQIKLAGNLRDNGDYGGAMLALANPIGEARRNREWDKLSEMVRLLGVAARNADKMDKAKEHLEEAMAICEAHPDESGVKQEYANALRDMALYHGDKEEYNQAIGLLCRSEGLCEQLRDEGGVRIAQIKQAFFEAKQGSQPGYDVLEFFASCPLDDNWFWNATAQFHYGQVRMDRRRYADAEQSFEQALNLHRKDREASVNPTAHAKRFVELYGHLAVCYERSGLDVQGEGYRKRALTELEAVPEGPARERVRRQALLT